MNKLYYQCNQEDTSMPLEFTHLEQYTSNRYYRRDKDTKSGEIEYTFDEFIQCWGRDLMTYRLELIYD